MAKLSDNWITEHLLDFEYKKYILLGYLQEVSSNFKEKKLYPHLTDLIDQYRKLITLKNRTEELKNNFKKELNGIDLENKKLIYSSLPGEEWEKEFNLIVDFSLPLMGNKVNEGKTIFDHVEENILFHPLGILPLNKNEGYFLLNPFQSKQVDAYSYSLSALPYHERSVYGLNVSYFSSYTLTIAKPLDVIKSDIIHNNPQLPNPAVFVFKAKEVFPNEETFLPIVKRMLYSKLVA